MPGCDAEEALGRALAGQELAVALVDVAREQRRGERVGARDEDGRHVEHVGGEPRGDERPDELARRDEHLAAEVAALLLRRELVLEVDAGGARLDERLHQLERVQRPAEAGLGVGDDRREPVRAVLALGRVDLVGAQQRVVDPLDERGGAVRRVEALVRVRVPGEVRVGRDLPAGEVDRLQPGLHHLHGLRAGERAERGDVGLLVQELPEPLGTEARERVLDAEAPAQPLDVLLRVRPLDAGDQPVLCCAHRPVLLVDCVHPFPGLDPKCPETSSLGFRILNACRSAARMARTSGYDPMSSSRSRGYEATSRDRRCAARASRARCLRDAEAATTRA